MGRARGIAVAVVRHPGSFEVCIWGFAIALAALPAVLDAYRYADEFWACLAVPAVVVTLIPILFGAVAQRAASFTRPATTFRWGLLDSLALLAVVYLTVFMVLRYSAYPPDFLSVMANPTPKSRLFIDGQGRENLLWILATLAVGGVLVFRSAQSRRPARRSQARGRA